MVTETLDLAEAVGQFANEGYYIARQLFTPEEIDEVRQVYTDYIESGPDLERSDANHFRLFDERHVRLQDDPLSHYPRLLMPHRYPDTPVGPLALKYMLDPRLYPLLEGFMGQTPVAAQSMFYFKPAGSRGHDLHQDNLFLKVRPGTCVAAWTAVDDADRENGGMVIVPGSQDMELVCPGESDTSRSFSNLRVEPPEGLSEFGVDLKAGDVLFFNGSLIHGSYPNTSRDRFRRALIFHYAPRGCEEIAKFYHPLLSFDGEAVSRAIATGGGPCGEAVPMKH